MENNSDTSRFLYRLCHDLRTPVRAVRMYAELLIRDTGNGVPVDFEQRLGFIMDGARRVDLLIDGLAKYSMALDSLPATAGPARMDVFLRSALAKLEKPIKDTDAEVTYDDLPRLTGDPDRLIQLFEAILRNALEHRSEAVPEIHVSATLDGSNWTFCVHDNGPGVETNELERIFEPFERLHGDGPGLGLATSRAIVTAHGGRIWAESSPGEGLKVCFTLPG